MMYVAERKVNATVFTDVEKTIERVITVTFTTCDYTVDGCRKTLNKKMKEYSANPFVKEVTPVSEHFAN